MRLVVSSVIGRSVGTRRVIGQISVENELHISAEDSILLQFRRSRERRGDLQPL